MTNKTKEKLVEALTDHIETIGGFDLVQLHNQYCEAVNYYDDQIYQNEEDFFETYFTGKIMDLVQQLGGNSDYNYYHDFVKYDSLGNLESCNSGNLSNWIDVKTIVEHIIEEDDDLGDSDIRDILDEHEQMDDDEGDDECDENESKD